MHINNKYNKIKQPAFINDIKLFPYQLSTIYRMEELEKKEIIIKKDNIVQTYNIDTGILGNLSGSGKTLCILTLCKRNKNKIEKIKNKMVIFNKNNYCKYNIHNEIIDYNNISLIVVNNHLIKQWEKEIKKIENLSYLTINNKNITVTDFEKYDILLCSSSMYNKFININNNTKWNRIIFDDADSLKSINKTPNYRFVWFVSSLYKNIYNTSYHNNSFIKQYFKKNNLQHFDTFIEISLITCDINYIKQNIKYSYINKINKMCKYSTYNYIVEDYLYYEIEHLIDNYEIENAILCLNGDICDETDILTYFSNIETTTTNFISNQINNLNKQKCSICIDKYQYPIMLTCCYNIFCFNCIFKLLEHDIKCPLCREELEFENMTLIQSNRIQNIKNNIINIKEIECYKLIEDNKHNNIIVFYIDSDFSNQYSIMNFKNILNDSGLLYYELKGNIHNIINKFNNGDRKILLINYNDFKYRGLNFDKVNDIIFYFNNNNNNIIQENIINSCFNINRSTDLQLNVYYLQNN